MDRYQLQLRINQLQVIRWKMTAYPERYDRYVREAAIDWCSMEINQHLNELYAAGYRKSA